MRLAPVFALSCALLLASCGSSVPSASVDSDDIPVASGSASSGASSSGAVASGSTAGESYDLTSETVASQLRKQQDGSVAVVDRRLFVMNLVRDHLESIDSLFDGVDSIEKSVESAGAKLSETDLAVIVAGVTIEAPQFPLCAQFAARRSSLDADRAAFAPIDTLCKNRAAAQAATASGTLDM
jgi:hypothetical protein